jgi:glucose-1-phosphate thymidylyltransferase
MVEKGVVLLEDSACEGGPAGRSAFSAREAVANRPIVHHVLEALRAAGTREIIVAASQPLAEEMRSCLEAWPGASEVAVHYVIRRGRMGLAAALRVAAPMVGSAPCIVHPANGLLGEPLHSVVEQMRTDAPDVVLVIEQDTAPAGPHVDGDNVVELAPRRPSVGDAALWTFGTGALERAAAAAQRRSTEFNLTAIERQITTAGGSLRLVPASNWRSYAGDAFELLELNQLVLERLEARHDPARAHANRIEGRVQIAEDAVVRESVIVGPTLIGPGAQVIDSYIGPYTSIGAGARVVGTEIERSIVAAGADVSHVGRRLAASVVGRNARVFRDFSLPRALRLQVGDGTLVALC